MTLSSIPPYDCRHCHDRIHWSDTIHEDYCQDNPKNSCPRCHTKFMGDERKKPEDRLREHLRHCYVKPKSQNVKTQFRNSQYAECHPTAVCQFCGHAFYSAPLEGSAMCEEHEMVCRSNPECRSSCQYCGLTFRSTIRAPASMQSLIHESNCRLNPKNECRYCG